MSVLFAFLFLLSLIMLPVVIIKPNLLEKMTKRKFTRLKAGLLLGGIILALFILIGLTTKPTVKNISEQKAETITSKPTFTPTTVPQTQKQTAPTLTPKPATATNIKKGAILSGKDKSGNIVVQDIAIWMKPGSGGIDNVYAGTVPDNTKVEVLDTKTVEGFVFYLIRSSVGRVDVLPTNFEARKKAMEKLPQSEWTVEADPSFPVEGWVVDSFVTNLK